MPSYQHQQRKAISTNFLRGGFAAAGRRSRNLRVTRCARFPLLPLTEGTSALQTPGRVQQRPTAARTPKVASHPAAPHDSRQRRRHQPRRSGEVLQPSGPRPPSPWRGPRPEMGRSGERKRSRVETPSGQQGREKRKGESEGRVRSCASCGRRSGHGPGPSAQRRCRRSSPASPALLGPARRTDQSRPRAGPRGTASLSHFVPSLLGLLLRCPVGQGEVDARWRLSRGKAGERAKRKTIVGSRRLLMGELLGGAAVPAGERASRPRTLR